MGLMKVPPILIAAFFIVLLPTESVTQAAGVTVEEVTYSKGGRPLKGTLCTPAGKGPFAAVIYNHGGVGSEVGGAPRETCEALAAEGLVGFSPIRRQTESLEGHLADIFAATDYVKGLPLVNKDKIAMIGFSRGAVLTLLAIAKRKDLKAGIVMAPAVGVLDEVFEQVPQISAPVLVLVAANDIERRGGRIRNHVSASREVVSALKKEGKNSTLIVYPPYKENGHRLFFEIGPYWKDIIDFLETHKLTR